MAGSKLNMLHIDPSKLHTLTNFDYEKCPGMLIGVAAILKIQYGPQKMWSRISLD